VNRHVFSPGPAYYLGRCRVCSDTRDGGPHRLGLVEWLRLLLRGPE